MGSSTRTDDPDLVFLNDLLKQTIGVIVDDENNTVLLIGLDGSVSVRHEEDDFDIQWQEFGEA